MIGCQPLRVTHREESLETLLDGHRRGPVHLFEGHSIMRDCRVEGQELNRTLGGEQRVVKSLFGMKSLSVVKCQSLELLVGQGTALGLDRIRSGRVNPGAARAADAGDYYLSDHRVREPEPVDRHLVEEPGRYSLLGPVEPRSSRLSPQSPRQP